MPVTLKDIAERLDLSISTVSYALNDGPKPVSEAVRKRVLRAAKELGYRPNRLARSLVTRRTHTIGVVPADVDHDILLKPNVHLALNGVFNAAAELRQDVLVFTAHDRNLPGAVADDLLDSRADGVVFISPRPDSPALLRIIESDLPHAVIAEEGLSTSISVDNERGVLALLEHLRALGHRRIAHVTGDFALPDARLRLATYERFMREEGLAIPEGFIFEGKYRSESGVAAAYHFARLDPMPTAVFCANDVSACGLVEAFRLQGIRCPEDVSVVGFDDSSWAATCHPPLTTVRQPFHAMAVEALQAVVRRIESGEEVQGRVFHPQLITRKSTAPPREEPIQ